MKAVETGGKTSHRRTALRLKFAPTFSKVILEALQQAGFSRAFHGPTTRFRRCLRRPCTLFNYGWSLDPGCNHMDPMAPTVYRLGTRSVGQCLVLDRQQQVARLCATGQGAWEEFVCDLKTGEVLSASSNQERPDFGMSFSRSPDGLEG
ncbi:MAG: hypothetical protein AB1758_05550 [Candidatus Eremiobacterota bacterium]